ncbi:hypothetical protein PYW07_004062 [Mythimna separata]|uniref:15-hydroxyprostaglandin dehydrogenase [NAD(+)]-like n=1 Tax=Mythimna separata TaxID=271217 RepID=A0AAD7YQS4_MYTSE|nr:hypothetical protein PYW07_004062 [Mythimna separata]
MYDLTDKIVVVTGASHGIGANFVRQVLEEGVQHVRILDVDVGSGDLLQNELNEKYGDDKVKFVKCDVTNDEQFFKALEDAKEDKGYIDLLVNNAGVADESKLSAIRRLIEINYIALVNGTLKAIELMRKDNGGRGGAVINISSIGGLIQVSPMFTYSSCKRAVMQFSHCVGQIPVAHTGVRVMSICIGVTDTAILGKIKCFEKRLDLEAQNVLGSHPVQSAESAARGMIDMYKKGESASIWLVRANEPAEDITAHILKTDAEIAEVIAGTSE